MTRIHLYRNGRGRLAGFSMIGHTGAAPEGEDIVCAGLSALSLSAANALETVAGVRAHIHVGPGLLSVRLPRGLDSARRHDAHVILRMTVQAFEEIRASYPEYVRITNQEVPPC